MPRWLKILGSALVSSGLMGCAGNHDYSKISQMDDVRARKVEALNADLDWTKRSETDLPQVVAAYATDRPCEGEAFTLARRTIDHYSMERTSYYSPTEPSDRLMLSLIGGAHMNAARSLVALGDQAAAKHCYATARKVYLDVISVFIGSDYGAYRQKAQVGIDEIRALKGRTI